MNISCLAKSVALLAAHMLLTACTTLHEPASVAGCEGNVQYDVAMESVWGPDAFPVAYPAATAHYSKLVGATHISQASLWSRGKPASEAIKAVAEKGVNLKLEKQVNWLIKIDQAGDYIDGPGLDSGTGIIRTSFMATPEFPYVSLISMIAPSPDWFVGVSGLALCVDGQWVEAVERDLIALDGGTDSGLEYAYATSATTTQPADVIQPVENVALDIGPSKPFAKLRLTRR